MGDRTPYSYLVRPSRFGDFAVVWSEGKAGAEVLRIFLPGKPLVPLVLLVFPGARSGEDESSALLARDIEAFLRGERVEFSLDRVCLDACSEFQRSVLVAEHRIPRGWLSTYGGIAASLGRPGAARAVGRALSTNPFPIVVPCHRAIKADGRLGGFQGGVPMKRALLEAEGVELSSEGSVVRPRLFY